MRGYNNDYSDMIFLKNKNPPDFTAVAGKYPLSTGGPPLRSKLKLCTVNVLLGYILNIQ